MKNKIIVITIVFFMALIDVICLAWIKKIHEKKAPTCSLIIPIIVYALQPILFYWAIGYSNMVIVNILWNILGIFLVTFVGIFVLKEKISNYSKIGLLFAFVAVFLFSIDDYKK